MKSDYRSGGGALNADVEAQQGGVNTLNVVNTLFVDNISGGNGGAIVLLGMGTSTGNSEANYINTTFSGNKAGQAGGGMHANVLSAKTKLVNSIILGNSASASDNGLSGSLTQTYSLIEGKTSTAGGNISSAGQTVNNVFKSTNRYDDDFLMLSGTSIAKNAGSNLAYDDAVHGAKDLAAQVRRMGNIDLGAYEEQTLPLSPSNGILYVKKGSTGNGSFWANAAGEVADALKYAKQTESSWTSAQPLQIWVAQGVYKPIYSPRNEAHLQSEGRNNAFLMVNHVKIYGGFAGTETQLSQRNFTTNVTVLSGDFNDDDTFVQQQGSLPEIQNNTENAIHVLVASGSLSNGELGGFTVKGGNGTGSAQIMVGNNQVWNNYGGGIFVINSLPKLKNVIFSHNNAQNRGGAIHNINSNSAEYSHIQFIENTAEYGGAMHIENSSPTVKDSKFVENNGYNSGGAVYNYNQSSPIFMGVTFSGNNAGNQGGGMYSTNSSPVVVNSIFERNVAIYGGGASFNDQSTAKFVNTTFYDNTVYSGGGTLANHSSNVYLDNSIMLKSLGSFATEGVYNSSSTFVRTNSLVEGYNDTQNGNISAQGIVDEDIFLSVVQTDAGYLQLKNESVVVNAGSNSAYNQIANAPTTDLAGNARIVADTIDMGAYENQCNTLAPTGEAAQGFCPGATVADLVAVGTDVKWYAEAVGGTELSETTPLVSGTTYHASQTVNACVSTTRLAVTVTINETAAPTGDATQQFCNSATVANLSAIGAGIKWYATATGGNALSSGTALVNGNTYYASQTVNGCESASRLAVTVELTSTAAPTGNAAQQFCGSATVANLSATGSNIKWYASATGGNALSAGTALVSGNTYHASQTLNGCESASRLAVTVTVTNTSAPTGNATQQFCNSATVANLSANGTDIKWYATATGGNALPSGTSLVSGNTYHASQTINGCESVSRLAVTVTVTTASAPTGNPNQQFCNSATVANLSASGTNIKWYAAATGGNALSAGTALVNENTYYASQTVNGCESVSRLAVTVTLSNTAAPTTSNANQTFSASSNPTLADLEIT